MISLCTAICTHHKPQKGALSPGHRRTGGAARWVAAGRTRDIAGCPGEESRWRLRWSGKRRCATSKTNTRLEPVLLLLLLLVLLVVVVVVGIVFSSRWKAALENRHEIFVEPAKARDRVMCPVDLFPCLCPASYSATRRSQILVIFSTWPDEPGFCRPFVTNRTANRFDHAPPFLRSAFLPFSSLSLSLFFFLELNFWERDSRFYRNLYNSCERDTNRSNTSVPGEIIQLANFRFN